MLFFTRFFKPMAEENGRIYFKCLHCPEEVYITGGSHSNTNSNCSFQLSKHIPHRNPLSEFQHHLRAKEKHLTEPVAALYDHLYILSVKEKKMPTQELVDMAMAKSSATLHHSFPFFKSDVLITEILMPKVQDAIARASTQLTLQESFNFQNMYRIVSRLL